MLTIELRSIGDIRPYPNNPRTNDNAVMHSVASKMTALEMVAVSEYLSGK